MKPAIGRIGLGITMLILTLGLKAQSFQAVYTYDNNGNRIEARVIYLSLKSTPETTEDEFEILSKHEQEILVKIHPNPTKGILTVDILCSDSDLFQLPKNGISLWDVRGKLLWETKTLETSNTIDLSAYPHGVYIVKLLFDGNVKTYKVIKN